MEQRLTRLRERMTAENLEALLILKKENRFYISGFTGSTGYLLVTHDEAILITDFRYTEQATEQCPHCRVVEAKDLIGSLQSELAAKKLTQLGFEKDYVNYGLFETLNGKLEGVTLVAKEGITEEIRLFKDESELVIMRKAAKIADDAFSHILGFLRPGISEIEVALELEFFMRKLGAKSSSFDIIVASGARSSLPHGVASEKILEAGDFVKMDFGAYYQGYCSDLTRTVVLGEASDKQREIYDIVLKSQLHTLENIKVGMTGKEADALARDIIAEHGYGDNFGHSLGHGLGTVVHEMPSLSVRGETVLKPGMTVTIEPGIYIPNFGGVRIEDDIVMQENGIEILTSSTKDFLIIG
ncbi:Xaa-Pro aminopeptidase [Tumebacillus sp. BK434]|uniref:M24 family metallopeptidase n=1 Tax=Tumebacillus sp. BK434 TaxID=2512169 RepID=UPI00104F36FA|nr:Xaa-Pro peptidase family protein [Tumebacillus sp. BK434]TCP59627.1 Xaa-Pro aminopeptidase [Tumebacillus sp. BK434]